MKHTLQCDVEARSMSAVITSCHRWFYVVVLCMVIKNRVEVVKAGGTVRIKAKKYSTVVCGTGWGVRRDFFRQTKKP